MKRLSILLATTALAATIGCSGGTGGGGGGKGAVDPKTGQVLKDSTGNPVSVKAAGKYKDGLEAFAKHDKAALTKLVERVRPHAGDGRHERFKSTQFFDGPYHQRQHGLTREDLDA